MHGERSYIKIQEHSFLIKESTIRKYVNFNEHKKRRTPPICDISSNKNILEHIALAFQT